MAIRTTFRTILALAAVLSPLAVSQTVRAQNVPEKPSTPPHTKPDAAEIARKLPPAATRQIDFALDIKPLFEASCIQCHAKGKAKGNLSLETREFMLKGGQNGPSIVVGKSAESTMVHLVAAVNPENVMPMKGTKWTPEQVGMLRAWIDQGANWDPSITFAKPAPLNLSPRPVPLPTGTEPHPIDRWMTAYFQSKSITPPPVVDDPTFARRAYLDVIGLLPTAQQLNEFAKDTSTDKRARLVTQLLADNANYADHWLTFWNDLLRNDYKGTGYIDGGRKQITGWLYTALLNNKPYNQFVAELVNPAPGAEGFTKGIVWRGNVNASMTPAMQAAQSISQVFLGVNLKCASCHDSFVSDWTLEDAYSLAAVYSDTPLEMVHCDKPTGKIALPKFLYPQIGTIDPAMPKAQRLQRFAELMTGPQNGRLSRTLVNRLWAKTMGRGLVEPLDEMEKSAWYPDMLDWLAEDLIANGYNVKRTLEVILTSRAYQLPTVAAPKEDDKKVQYVFNGPLTRRMTAEQFSDAISGVSGQWAEFPTSKDFDFSGGGAQLYGAKLPGWVWTDEPLDAGVRRGGWQVVKRKIDEAQQRVAETQKLVTEGAANATEAAAKAKAASEEAAKLIAEAQAVLESPERVAQIAAAPEKLSPAAAGIVRHNVVFRKKFTINNDPAEAFGVIAASQRAELRVNNKRVGAVLTPGDTDRAAVYDLRNILVKGDNVIVISVDSHTEKPRDATTPQLAQHLNGRSGMAFYARYREGAGGNLLEITSDPTWHVRRAPEVDPDDPKLDPKTWLTAKGLGFSPIDEGPALDAIGRATPENPGLDIGTKLPGAIAVTARAGKIRSGLLVSDPLQLAMARPNREIVVPVRSDAPTTIQGLEFTNGATLDEKLKAASRKLQPIASQNPGAWIESIYAQSLARKPTDDEKKIATEMLGAPVTPEGIADFLWAVTMLPEFQLIN